MTGSLLHTDTAHDDQSFPDLRDIKSVYQHVVASESNRGVMDGPCVPYRLSPRASVKGT